MDYEDVFSDCHTDIGTARRLHQETRKKCNYNQLPLPNSSIIFEFDILIQLETIYTECSSDTKQVLPS